MSDNSEQKTLKDLNLLDSFLFSEVTENPQNAKMIARIIIKRVLGWYLNDDIQVEVEKQYKGFKLGLKGIRLDLQVKESENKKIIRFYDLEPNRYIEKHLAKRSRYYLSLTDIKLLGSSKKYEELPEYFSVWILPYDPFGDNRMIYTIKNAVVENPELVYNDSVTRIFLYTDGEIGGNDELRALLKYFKNTQESNALDGELKDIQSVVSDIKNNEEVGERYMTMEEMLEYERDASYSKGRAEGHAEGRAEGHAEGRAEGRAEGSIVGAIKMCRKFGKTDAETIKELMDEFELSYDEAEEKLRMSNN